MKMSIQIDDVSDDDLVRFANLNGAYSVLWDFAQYLRTKVKYDDSAMPVEPIVIYQEIQRRFLEIMDDKGLDLSKI